MKNIFVTFILIFCGAISVVACESCMLSNGYHLMYGYKGNVKTAHAVNIRKYLDSLGNEKIDTMAITFRQFDKNHKCMLLDYENRSTGSSAYLRHELINGKYEIVESRGPFPMLNSRRIYSNDGKLLEEHSPIAVKLFNPQGKKYCTITYESTQSKKIAKYEYVYYDKNGKDTAIISKDRYFNVISHIKKVYDKRGNLSEEYENGKLTSYHRYDSKGRLLADSTFCGKETYTYDSKGNILAIQKSNDCIYAGSKKLPTKITVEKYEYGKNGEKIVQEFVGGELDNIQRYDKNGNRTYFRRYSCCPKIECKDKYDEKNRKIESISTYFNDNGTFTDIQKYKNGEKDLFSVEAYRNDTLVSIDSYEEKRIDNKLISTTVKGVEDKTEKGKLNIDTVTLVTTFDKNDKILTKCSYDKSGEADCTRYTYNEQGQTLSIVHDKPHYNDFYVYVTRIDYKYDEHHNLLSETHWNGDEMIHQTTNRYDANHELVEKSEELGGGHTWIKYDKVGNIVEVVESSEGSIMVTKSGETPIEYNDPVDIYTTTYTYYDE
ncbi:MAG: hypothetical protein J5554_07635 [Paludibacteraceae bacterium]|nr:hypothetical protein [Paludibacteraceae bacterium]